jgi:hypothetical protein
MLPPPGSALLCAVLDLAAERAARALDQAGVSFAAAVLRLTLAAPTFRRHPPAVPTVAQPPPTR